MKKHWKLIAILSVAALAAAIGIAALASLVIVPANNYSKAAALEAQGDTAGAYDTFDRLVERSPHFRDAEARRDDLQQTVLDSRTTESLSFGGWDWLVLEIRDGKALLLLKEVPELRSYHETLAATGWETCSLRKYLNGTFYDRFSQEEQRRIVETEVINSANAEYGISCGGNTKDFIFLLSLAEAKLYFPENGSRIAHHDGSAAWWWLRSPGLDASLAATVGSDGVINHAGSGVNYSNRGLRPAMWVTLP